MVQPEEMVGVSANVLARLLWSTMQVVSEDDCPPKLRGAIHEALYALDLDVHISTSDLTRLMT